MSRQTPFRMLAVALALVLTFALIAPATAQVAPPQIDPARIKQLRLDAPVETTNPRGVLSPTLQDATGRRQVVIRLRENPAAMVEEGAAQLAQVDRVRAQQDRVLARIQAIDPTATEYARLRIGLNALIVEVDAAALPAIARDAEVTRINAVVHYERDLDETVPYIGASPEVQDLAFKGEDVRVAVLDSGIDYTHIAFDGPGTPEAYALAYCGDETITPDPTNPACRAAAAAAPDPTLFGPGAPRIKGGFDFVGEVWPNGPLAPDPNPIDFEGHGTHVADIIGGRQGVAPKVDLYAVKVCSAVSSSCNGIALLQGLEFAADPNGDGMTDDHVHIVNMSLGASYGQNYDDDLSVLVDAITPIGILVVASAGNSADRPYISGTPAAARSALSVAQTAVPRDKAFPITVAGVTVFGIAQPWAPEPTTAISGNLVYGASLGNALGCTAFPAGSLTGQVLLVDRGACAVSIKGSNGAAAGAVAVIVANNAAGVVPPSFGFGGGSPTVPTLSITQAAGTALKARVGNVATVDGANPQSSVGSVVGTSSRGPVMGQMFYGNQVMYGQIIKPEIGAPGASISAVAGSGDGVEPFGGTSGAAPVVAGAAALLMNATNWQLSPWELKARLMNTAETSILNGPQVFVGSSLAPITRIGGGEVRIDRAVASQASAWESVSRGGALSFGMVDLTRETTLRRTVVVRNYGNTPLTYSINPTFRFADDAATGAVTPVVPSTITVPPRSQRSFPIALRIDPTKLPFWALNSGPNGGNGDVLTLVEYDGHLTLDAPGTVNDLTMPWQVLPRAAGNVRAPVSVRLRGGSATATLTNSGLNPVDVETFVLIGENPFVTASPGAGQQAPPMDLRYVGVATYGVPPTFCSSSLLIRFAINTHQRITHSNYPVEFDLLFDTNRDGRPDYIGFTSEVGTFASSGQNAFFVGTPAGPFQAFFFTEHPTNSANTIVTICGEQIGVTSPGQQINVDAYVYDNYFTGLDLSYIDGMSTVIGAPRYVDSFYLTSGGGTVPASGGASLQIFSTGSTATTTESGILLMFSYGPAGNEARAIKVR